MLPMARLAGEGARTVNQAQLFAQVVRDGLWLDARIDSVLPDRKPLPRPDIRRTHVPLGPIAVFGASNFPLAISVAGTDTIAALGVGCPVVVKAHPAHPGTSEIIASAIQCAIDKTGYPLDSTYPNIIVSAGVEDYPRTLMELEKRFSSDQACREYLFALRWPEGFICPRCGGGQAWPTGRGLWLCAQCRH